MKTLFAAIALFLASLASADFAFSDFNNANTLVFNGDAAVSNGVLRITPAEEDRVGSVYHENRQDVASAWETSFTFKITDLDTNFGGADGFSFIIQNDSEFALGDGGSGLGYQGIPNSLAIEFDLFGGGEDPNDNHVSVQTRGLDPNNSHPEFSIGSAEEDLPDMSDGQEHNVRIVYFENYLRIFLDDMVDPIMAIVIDLDSDYDLTDGTAYIGFTGATGGGFENHDILRWSFSNNSSGVTHYVVTSGAEFQGNLQSLVVGDFNFLCMLNDDTTLITQVEVYGLTESVGPDYHVDIFWDITRPGLSMTIDLRSAGGGWTNVFGGTQVGMGGIGIGTSSAPFVGDDGELGVRMTWQPINDEDPSQDGWAICLDMVKWTIE